jgi:3-phosphoshikimate 1-carboxyvinyltransferase
MKIADQGDPSSKFLTITPGYPLIGESGVAGCPAIPGDKSLSHRAILLAAMAQGESVVEHLLVSGVTAAMLNAMTSLKVPWQLDGERLTLQGVGIGKGRQIAAPSPVELDCGNSATTLRLLAGALAAWAQPASLTGSPGLQRRPMNRIVDPLQQMGVEIRSQHGCAPLSLGASPLPLQGRVHRLKVASAQVKSCLLLAALSGDGPSTIYEPGPSRDHSERLLGSMGVRVQTRQENTWLSDCQAEPSRDYITEIWPAPPAGLRPLHLRLPGDFSAAAFLVVAALVTPGSRLRLNAVGLNPTRTGLLDALRGMGAQIEILNQDEQQGEPVGDLLIQHSALHATEVSGDLVVRMIDEFPAFAAAAAYAQGTSLVRDAQELRLKESDRISALCSELRKLGVSASERQDGFEIEGGKPPHGGTVTAHGDHRLAMSLALCGLAAQAPVVVEQAEIIAESFPDFPRFLSALGAQVSIQPNL